ncbi:disease resistance protein At4g27190-like [Prosopis cineraria]|uniref:disease resistance protein At4g27190-like n=1 Tax=Prosopis cineraria TaxID=364024 RepID=UPI00240F1F09|nr:disease resistance protein At4g27190-like [Prosopis cineraria]XP_054780471.1 disease resistance protein At4g27190-like [Prosopis cineraria]XP_054780472.1 disease resistance protein At4g27190-like [Prosopis cineraria]XP_054780473.1 disease resistance protein At4g27190-like [Prosopis cineraria]XP_054780474.1 disease resistance protein At4g27190-like [Prosopis cineraria]XP_054780475.1 disease resistance protein At4g27190-like [Prosopis cineraria]XP_054780476.1 disease resistance protein At4g2
MEILSAIAGEIAKYTLKPIVRQVGYLFFYKDNFKELKDQVEALGIAKERIVHEVEAERRNGREIEADVGEWLKKADTTLKEADGVCKDPRCVKADCSGWCFPNLISRHQLSRNAKKTVENVAKVLTNGKFDRIAHLPPLPTIITISVKLESRNKMKEEILLALKDPKLSRIGVYGLSGVGKTTLAGEIVEQVKHERLFDEVVMVTISQTADIDRIQDEMADKLGLRFGERSMAGKAGRLYDRITREKAILIILDDIYNQLNLDNLGIPSKDKYKLGISIEDNYKGCKLLLTSRDKKILENYDTEKNFRLEVLNDEESRRLFQNMNDDAVGDVELQDIAAQVTRSCAGLPVVIVTMAKALRNKGIDFWENALKKLESVDNGERVFEALQFSYNQLKDEEVKQVFLLCGVQGTSTYVSDLLKYVFGLGIFKQVDTVEDARIKLRETMADLKSCCLLLDHDATIKMHDTVCKVAIKIAFRDFYVFTLERTIGLQGLPDGDFLKRCSQINLIRCCIRQLPEKLDCPDLKFLHLNSKDNPSLEIPNSFFEGMRKLEVLDVTGMIVPSLPTSLVSLTKLKTLCLDHCYLKDMAGIGVLKNLKILSFIHSSMEEFPSEIGQLTHLKMLDLRNSGIEVIPPNIVSQLTKLEELYIGNALIKWGVDNSAKQNKNASLSELRHLTSLSTLEIQTETWILTRGIRFENLKRYKIVVGDKWEWPYYNETSRLLKLKLDTHIPSEHGIKMLIKRAEDLYLDEVNGISNVVFQLNGEGFPLLKHLHIQYNGEIQYIINSIGRNQTNVILFPKLETLILQNLSMLEEICHGPLWVGSFRELRVIKLKSCGKLEYVLLNSMIKEFSQLVEMDVSECPSVKNIVFMESMNSGMVINKVEFLPLRRLALQYLHAMVGFRSDNPALFFDAKVSLPNLDSLKLSSINLNKIWDDHQLSVPNSFQNLAHLIVEECGNLQYLFLPSMVENLKNLKQLKVSKCDKMEEIIATEGRNNEITLNQEAGFSKLEEIIINDMKNLKTAWHYQFGRLKTLEIKKCERLETIFPAGYMREALRSLETLKVCDCALVKEIFHLTANGMGTEEATTQLKSLVLHGLPKMKQIWSRDPQGLFRFFNLQLVQIEDCENLEYVFPFSIAKDLPQLDDLQLVSCGIKEVVSKKDGPMDETTIFELNHLTCVKLVRLHKLKEFYVGAHTLECQSLRKLFVLNCKLLKLFNSRSSRCQESPSYHQPHFSKPQPLFQVEEVIGNLHILALRCVDANMILQHQVPGELFCEIKDLVITEFEDDKATFPHWFLKNLPKLEVLTVMTSSFKEIFCDETLIDEEGQDKISTRVKRLSLSTLPELQDLCRGGSQIHPVLELLEILTVIECSNLRNLVPSSATFCHLTCMVITNCHSLKSLMTASTARSLVKLQTMKLEECKSLQKVVTEEVNETEHEIAFNSLLILELNYLPVLHSFSSSKYSFKFPWLERVVVSQCPRMQIFSAKATSTPKLKKVLIEEKACGEYYWQGDLNGTINNMYLNKVAFCSFVHLKVSDYPELGELWYGQVKNKLFCNLKSLVVQNCHWLSNFLLSGNILEALSNLKELEVRECVTLEAVFELGDINERGLIVREIKKNNSV